VNKREKNIALMEFAFWWDDKISKKFTMCNGMVINEKYETQSRDKKC
jgi:hypothetical protein